MSKIASAQVKVALTGQGADEPWAGYDRYLGVQLSALYSRMPSRDHGAGRALAVARLPVPMERLKRGVVVAWASADVLTRFAKIYSFFSAEMKAQLYRER